MLFLLALPCQSPDSLSTLAWCLAGARLVVALGVLVVHDVSGVHGPFLIDAIPDHFLGRVGANDLEALSPYPQGDMAVELGPIPNAVLAAITFKLPGFIPVMGKRMRVFIFTVTMMSTSTSSAWVMA